MRSGQSAKPSSHHDPIPLAAVVAAGGSGSRMRATVPKQFLEIAGRPILLRAVEQLLRLQSVVQIVVALPAGQIAKARAILEGLEARIPILCVRGGSTRQESVRRAVGRVTRRARLILVHDAVRPLCDEATMTRVVEAAAEHGAAVPGLVATDTIQRVSRRGRILATPPREELFAIQTPQCFDAAILRASLERAAREGYTGTDESSVVRRAGHAVTVVPGSPTNIKITRPLDVAMAERILSEDPDTPTGRVVAGGGTVFRIGQGVDYHRLVRGRKLILGGVAIPFEKGLEGYSDADALLHAVCDALLGAAGMGDIGGHYPDSDPRNRERSSLEFLEEIRAKVESAGWKIANVDATVVAQRPKLAPHIESMRRNIAKGLGLDTSSVNVKATTTEGMNAEGRGEGISAQAIALIAR